MNLTLDGAQNLLEALLADSVKVYVKAKAKILTGRGTYHDEDDVSEVTNFLESDWFKLISPIDKSIVYRACDMRVKDEVDEYNKKKENNTMKILKHYSELELLNMIVDAGSENKADARDTAIRNFIFGKMFEGVKIKGIEDVAALVLGKSFKSRNGNGKSTSRVSAKEANQIAEDIMTAFGKVGLL